MIQTKYKGQSRKYKVSSKDPCLFVSGLRGPSTWFYAVETRGSAAQKAFAAQIRCEGPKGPYFGRIWRVSVPLTASAVGPTLTFGNCGLGTC
jgi:hypothetical protein